MNRLVTDEWLFLLSEVPVSQKYLRNIIVDSASSIAKIPQIDVKTNARKCLNRFDSFVRNKP
jgi:hypothetical protein